MKTLMEKYMHALNDERDAFWDYIEIMKCEGAKDSKSTIAAIAQDELQHFHKLIEIVWADETNKTELEKAFRSALLCEYDEMKECFEHHKG